MLVTYVLQFIFAVIAVQLFRVSLDALSSSRKLSLPLSVREQAFGVRRSVVVL